jgi:hypothetical protein
MATMVRTWLGLAALGAGLIHLAVAAGAPPVLLAVFAALGAAELAWGVAALARWTVPFPRISVAAITVPTLLWVVLLLVAAGDVHGAAHASGTHTAAMTGPLAAQLPVGPLLAAALLDISIAAVLAVRLRGGRPDGRPTHKPGVWTYLVGVLGGAGVIFALTSAALGGTAVGQVAMTTMVGH